MDTNANKNDPDVVTIISDDSDTETTGEGISSRISLAKKEEDDSNEGLYVFGF